MAYLFARSFALGLRVGLRQVIDPFLPLTSVGFYAIQWHVLCRISVIRR
jgi:hypothetical protein